MLLKGSALTAILKFDFISLNFMKTKNKFTARSFFWNPNKNLKKKKIQGKNHYIPIFIYFSLVRIRIPDLYLG